MGWIKDLWLVQAFYILLDFILLINSCMKYFRIYFNFHCVSVHTRGKCCLPMELRSQILLELGLKEVVSHPMWMLKIELRSSARAVCVLFFN